MPLLESPWVEIVRDLLRFGAVTGLLGFLAYFNFAKMATGSAFLVVSYFAPFMRHNEEKDGKFQFVLSPKMLKVALKGTVRFGLLAAGILLVAPAAFEGGQAYFRDSPQARTAKGEQWFSRLFPPQASDGTIDLSTEKRP